MGVESFLLASAVETVIAQRLVRKLCENCRQIALPETEYLQEANFPLARLNGNVIYTPGTCEKCRQTGFKGRRGIFEVLEVTEAIRSLVIQRAPMNVIKQKAIAEGMCTLRDDGWNKVLAGITTIEEVLRASEEND